MNEEVIVNETVEESTQIAESGLDVKARVLVLGAVLGSIFGLVAAKLYLNVTPIQQDVEGKEVVATPPPANILKFSLGALSLLRQIVE